MKVKSLGKKENPAVLMVPGMFCTSDMPGTIAHLFVFLFSEKEPARRSEKRLKEKYPEASFLVARGYGHSGFQAADPEKYARLLRSIMEGNVDGSAVI